MGNHRATHHLIDLFAPKAELVHQSGQHRAQHGKIGLIGISTVATRKRNARRAHNGHFAKFSHPYALPSLRALSGPPRNGANPVPKITPISASRSLATTPSASTT